EVQTCAMPIWRADRRRVGLLDDRRALERRATEQSRAVVDRGVDRAGLGEMDIARPEDRLLRGTRARLGNQLPHRRGAKRRQACVHELDAGQVEPDGVAALLLVADQEAAE